MRALEGVAGQLVAGARRSRWKCTAPARAVRGAARSQPAAPSALRRLQVHKPPGLTQRRRQPRTPARAGRRRTAGRAAPGRSGRRGARAIQASASAARRAARRPSAAACDARSAARQDRVAFQQHAPRPAPRDAASKPSAPLPAKASSTRQPVRSCPSQLNSVSRTRSGVGPQAGPVGHRQLAALPLSADRGGTSRASASDCAPGCRARHQRLGLARRVNSP